MGIWLFWTDLGVLKWVKSGCGMNGDVWDIFWIAVGLYIWMIGLEENSYPDYCFTFCDEICIEHSLTN